MALGPTSRTSHPATSDAAGREIDKSGKRQKQAVIVAKMVKLRPGLTSNELAHLSSNPDKLRHVVARRLIDGERLGLIHRAQARRDRFTNKMALTWVPAFTIDPTTGELS